MAGSAKYKQRITVWNCVVCQGQILSAMKKQREIVYLVCLAINNLSVKIFSLLDKMYSPKLECTFNGDKNGVPMWKDEGDQ